MRPKTSPLDTTCFLTRSGVGRGGRMRFGGYLGGGGANLECGGPHGRGRKSRRGLRSRGGATHRNGIITHMAGRGKRTPVELSQTTGCQSVSLFYTRLVYFFQHDTQHYFFFSLLKKIYICRSALPSLTAATAECPGAGLNTALTQ